MLRSLFFFGVQMSKRKKKATETAQNNHFSLKEIRPLTPNQSDTFDSFKAGKNLLLHGSPGSGKTFLSIYLALDEVLNKNRYKQVVIIRSVVPSRDMGHLPGSVKEKSAVYEEPYKIICDDLFGRGDGYDILKTKKLVNFTTTSFLRGITLDNSIVIVDEVQNMAFHECNTVMTRIGENCKVIFCGDFRQSDFTNHLEREGVIKFMQILNKMDSFGHIEFTRDDIVRSGLVREYLITKETLNL